MENTDQLIQESVKCETEKIIDELTVQPQSHIWSETEQCYVPNPNPYWYEFWLIKNN